MSLDLISFLIGIHSSVMILIISAFIYGGGLKSNKKSDWLLLLAFLISWEMATVVTLILSNKKKKEETNMTIEERIKLYRKEIRKADRRLDSKLEAFDKFEDWMLKEYGIEQTSKDKWIVAIRNWHTDTVSDLIIKIDKLKGGNK
jgi:hypothetical protein